MKDPSVAQSIVFVVDDDAAIREALESLFEPAGLQVALLFKSVGLYVELVLRNSSAEAN
jgi:FixJ family two-component response regulator